MMQYKSFCLLETGDPVWFDSCSCIADSQLWLSRPWPIVFRSGRALDSQSLKDRDAVLKQFFSSKIANVWLYLFPEALRFLYFFDVTFRFKAKQMLQMQISWLPLMIYQAYCPLFHHPLASLASTSHMTFQMLEFNCSRWMILSTNVSEYTEAIFESVCFAAFR